MFFWKAVSSGFWLQRRFKGHAHWQNIMHTKGRNDAIKGKTFSKYAKEIRIAIKLGGSNDPLLNSQLAAALQRATKAQVPKHVIEKAVSPKDKEVLEERIFGASGPNGVMMIIKCLTDSPQRALSDVRQAVEKNNVCKLVTQAAVGFYFDELGFVDLKLPDDPKQFESFEEKLFEDILSVGATDLDFDKDPDDSGKHQEVCTVYCETNNLVKTSKFLKEKGYTIEDEKISFRPKSFVEYVIPENGKNWLSSTLIKLDECDDVSDVVTNVK